MAYDVEISECPLTAWFDLRGDQATAAECLAVLGAPAEIRPNHAVATADGRVFRVGPRHWLLRCPIEREAEIATHLAQIVTERPASATLVSDLYAGFRLSGPDASQVLAQGCALDLQRHGRDAEFASFTEVFGLRTLLQVEPDGPSYRLDVDRSFADFLRLWLHRAAGPARG